MTIAVDLYPLSENQRIKEIAKSLREAKPKDPDKPVVIGFIVENNEKADRYIKKLTMAMPGVRVIDRFPFNGAIAVKVSPALQ